MRKPQNMFIIIILFLFPIIAHAWECPNEDRQSLPIEQNIELASDVIIGKVVSGSEESGKIRFLVKISQVFKGKLKNQVKLTTEFPMLFPDIVLGETYVFMLYGKNEVDFCAPVFRLGGGSNPQVRIFSNPEYFSSTSLSDGEFEKLLALYRYFEKKP